MDGTTEENHVKADDVEILQKPNVEEDFFADGNGPDLSAPTALAADDSIASAGVSATVGASGTSSVAAPVVASGEFEDGADFRFSQGGRGGFRGRPWGPPGGGGAPPRFRGRGSFGPPGNSSGSPMRLGGRGGGPPGQPPFFRGGRGGNGPPGSGGNNRFGGPNFDPNWGPPPGMLGANPYGPPPLMMSAGGNSGSTNANNGQYGNAVQQAELWVETKTEEGKSYYYHALSRETTWTRPEGAHIKIMSQTDVEALTVKNQQQQQQNQQLQQQQQQQQKPPQQLNTAAEQSDENTKGSSEAGATASVIPPLLKPANENGQITANSADKGEPGTKAADSTTNLDSTPLAESKSAEPTVQPIQQIVQQPLLPSLQQLQHQPPPNQQHQPLPLQQQPPLLQQQPPLLQQQPPLLQQQPPLLQQQPPPLLQQQPPPQQQHHHPQHHQQMPQHYGAPPPQYGGPQYGMPPPGYGGYPSGPWGMPWQQQQQQQQQAMVEQPAKNLILKPGVIEPQVIARAAEWSEHRAPDGRPYYYHAGRGESVWEKPQSIRDLEAARMAAHAGNTPQPPVQMPPGPVMTAMQINATPVITPQMQQIHQIQVQPHSVMFDPMSFAMKPQEIKMDESIEVKLEKKRKLDAEKKKKDDEEKARLQAAKQMDKSRPISSTPIAGTPWCVVWTGDGRVFFYNPSSRTSVWERPEDLLGRPDVDKAINTMPEQLVANMPKEEKAQVEIVMDTTAASAAAEASAAAAVTRRRTDSESSENGEDTPTKRAKLDNSAIPATSKQPDKKMDIGKEAAIEAEVRAARERALVPLDIRVKSFKEMLKEKDVSAFSTWEKELHKIVFDPRYLLLTSRERKQVFEKYVKERAEEERREKRNKMRQKRDDFRALMEVANLHGKSSFSDFGQKYGKDDRFKGIEKMRERESLFNEFIVEVRRREKEDKLLKKEQIRKDFIALLREHSDIDRHSRWIDVKKKVESDSRYRAVDNSSVREDYFLDFCKILKEEKKKIKEKERERKEKKEREKREKERNREKDRGGDKDKDRLKDKLHRDGKDAERASSDKKETDDRAATDEVEDGEKPDTSEDEAERQQRERDRQMRAEQSIKEREKEVQIQLAGHLRDRDKEREHHKRDEAMRHFSALLADLVRNADLTWKEVKKQLRKDHRWELVEQLEREDRERLFNDHIDQLSKKKRDKFREMLDDVPKLNLSTAFKDVKKTIRDDPRYLKYSSSEKCEREFRDYIKDKTIEAKASFRELLQECKLITHKSFETVGENPLHIKEIEEILKNDKRYLVLEHLTYDRSQMLTTYLEDLHKRGPPPPPTASESTRRK